MEVGARTILIVSKPQASAWCNRERATRIVVPGAILPHFFGKRSIWLLVADTDIKASRPPRSFVNLNSSSFWTASASEAYKARSTLTRKGIFVTRFKFTLVRKKQRIRLAFVKEIPTLIWEEKRKVGGHIRRKNTLLGSVVRWVRVGQLKAGKSGGILNGRLLGPTQNYSLGPLPLPCIFWTRAK